MNGFIRYFVERPLMVNVLALTIVVLAFFLVRDVPREYIPSIDMPRATLVAQLPGASSRDMETKITIPIEEAIETVDGIDEFSTTISDSVSFTNIEFYIDSTEDQVDTAMQDIRDAVDGITDFPPEMEDEPVLTRFNPSKWSIIEVAVSGPMDTLAPFAKDLERRIQRLPSVSRATVVGLQDPEVRVLIHPERAREHNVTVLDVVNAVRRHNVSSTGATLESPDARKQVVVWSRFDDPVEVGQVIVAAQPGAGVVRIRDIARVESTREDTGLLTHTNSKPGLSIVVRKRENADGIEAVEEVRHLLASTAIPDGLTYELVNDRTFFISNRLSVMLTNGLMGALLVTIILFVFMRKEAAVWVLVGIPIVFCGALATFPVFGMTLNLFTLTGLVIVLGMVVDDAVVVAENIAAKTEAGATPHDGAITGAQEMMRPVTAAAATTMLAFLPIIAMGGIPGKVMWQIPAAVVLVLVFSLIESFTVLPAHMAHGRVASGSGKRPIVLWLEDRYGRALDFCLTHRTIVVLIALAVFVAVMAVVRPLVPFVQFPQTDARILFVKLSTPRGTPLEQTEAVAASLQQQISQITTEDFRAVTARIGHQDVNGGEKERGEAENEALITVEFRELDRARTNAEWIQVLKRELILPQGSTVNMQSEFVGPPSGQPVELYVLSNDDELRRAVALEVFDFVASTPGTTQLEIDERIGTAKLDLNLNYEKLALLGLDPTTVTQTVQASFFGIEATEHRDMDDTTEVRVMFDQAARGDLAAFLETPIRTPANRLVTLRDVVEPIEVPGLDRIFHREGSRATTIYASFEPGSGLTALAYAQVLERDLMPRFNGLQGVEVIIGGEAADTEESTGDLGSVAILVVLAIAVVIWIMLGSLIEALFVVLVIPFAVAGVILAFFLHGLQLSMPAMIGVIGLSGVVVNASIVMIDAIHRARANAASTTSPRAVMRGAVISRLRPILITTLTTLGGVMPTAYGIGGYDVIVSPMSVAIGWGLVFSTGVTLFVVPVLFSVAEDLTTWIDRKRAPSAEASSA